MRVNTILEEDPQPRETLVGRIRVTANLRIQRGTVKGNGLIPVDF